MSWFDLSELAGFMDPGLGRSDYPSWMREGSRFRPPRETVTVRTSDRGPMHDLKPEAGEITRRKSIISTYKKPVLGKPEDWKGVPGERGRDVRTIASSKAPGFLSKGIPEDEFFKTLESSGKILRPKQFKAYDEFERSLSYSEYMKIKKLNPSLLRDWLQSGRYSPPPDLWRAQSQPSGKSSQAFVSASQKQLMSKRGARVKGTFTEVIDQPLGTGASKREVMSWLTKRIAEVELRAKGRADPQKRAMDFEESRALLQEMNRLKLGGFVRPGIPVKRSVRVMDEMTSGEAAEVQQREMARRGVRVKRPEGWRPDLDFSVMRKKRAADAQKKAEELAKASALRAMTTSQAFVRMNEWDRLAFLKQNKERFRMADGKLYPGLRSLYGKLKKSYDAGARARRAARESRELIAAAEAAGARSPEGVVPGPSPMERRFGTRGTPRSYESAAMRALRASGGPGAIMRSKRFVQPRPPVVASRDPWLPKATVTKKKRVVTRAKPKVPSETERMAAALKAAGGPMSGMSLQQKLAWMKANVSKFRYRNGRLYAPFKRYYNLLVAQAKAEAPPVARRAGPVRATPKWGVTTKPAPRAVTRQPARRPAMDLPMSPPARRAPAEPLPAWGVATTSAPRVQTGVSGIDLIGETF